MNGLKKVFYFTFCLLLSNILICCSSGKKKQQNEIHFVKPPKWVREAGNRGEFSAIGLTNKDVSLKEAKKISEQNALENLKSDIIVKAENLFLEETAFLNLEKRKKMVLSLNKCISDNLSDEFLKSITRTDSLWKSPDSNVFYIKVIADKKLLSTKLAEYLNKTKEKYEFNDNLLMLLSKIQNDMVYNDFKCSKNKNNVMMDDEDIANPSYKNDEIVIKNIILTDKKKIEEMDDESNEFTKDDDEIDKKVKNIIKESKNK